jgi:hypothetical protein
MRTTIPWGDGTGDNIYLDYSASEGNQTVAVSSDANQGLNKRQKNVTFSASGVSPVSLTVEQKGTRTPIEDLTARIYFNGNSYCLTDIVPTPGDWFKAKFAFLNTGGTDRYVFGYRNRSNADQDAISIAGDSYGMGYYALKAKMFGTQYNSAQAVISNTRYVIEARQTGVDITPSLGTFSSLTYAFSNAGAIALGALHYANNTTGSATGTIDLFGLEIYGSDNSLKHRLIPQQNLTFLDEITQQSYSCNGTVIYADDN